MPLKKLEIGSNNIYHFLVAGGFGHDGCKIVHLPPHDIITSINVEIYGAVWKEVQLEHGYFQVLYSCIEKLLAFLNVGTFVLPATDEAKSIWTEKFGFKKIPEEQLLNYKKICWQMVTFKGTSMLEKPVPKCCIDNQDKEDSDASFQ